MTAMEALMVRLTALGYFVCRLFTLPKLVEEEVATLVVDNEGDDARTRTDNDELKARVNNLQAILNFMFPDDVRAGFDQFEREVRPYHAITGKHIHEDTMSGVILGALAKSPTEKHRDLANHLVFNAYRLDSYDKMFVEIREILGTKKYMSQESAINAVSEAKGKKGKQGESKGRITIKFAGNCWVCVKSSHKKQDCWHNTCEKPKNKAATRSTMTDKSLTCEHCGPKGHRRSECYKLKAEQAARPTSSSTTSLTDSDSMAKKRIKRHCGS